MATSSSVMISLGDARSWGDGEDRPGSTRRVSIALAVAAHDLHDPRLDHRPRRRGQVTLSSSGTTLPRPRISADRDEAAGVEHEPTRAAFAGGRGVDRDAGSDPVDPASAFLCDRDVVGVHRERDAGTLISAVALRQRRETVGDRVPRTLEGEQTRIEDARNGNAQETLRRSTRSSPVSRPATCHTSGSRRSTPRRR